MEEKYIQIGQTKKPHGLKGELKLYLEEKYEEDFEQTEVLFLAIGGNQTPFFVENIRGGLFPILKLEGIDSRDQAMGISKKHMFLRESDLIPEAERELEPEDSSFKNLIDFTIIDETEGEVGKIIEIIDMPQQEMAVVTYKKKDIYIPMHSDLIIEVINDREIVKMNLPNGLLEL